MRYDTEFSFQFEELISLIVSVPDLTEELHFGVFGLL